MKQREFEFKYGKVIEEAKLYWKSLVESTFDQYGDKGSAVLGDGIMVTLVPPKCRTPRGVVVIPSSSVSKVVGSLHYEVHAKAVVEYLRSHGIKARYHYGSLD